jgi:capsular exopolysaccharide synthesis family protein
MDSSAVSGDSQGSGVREVPEEGLGHRARAHQEGQATPEPPAVETVSPSFACVSEAAPAPVAVASPNLPATVEEDQSSVPAGLAASPVSVIPAADLAEQIAEVRLRMMSALADSPEEPSVPQETAPPAMPDETPDGGELGGRRSGRTTPGLVEPRSQASDGRSSTWPREIRDRPAQWLRRIRDDSRALFARVRHLVKPKPRPRPDRVETAPTPAPVPLSPSASPRERVRVIAAPARAMGNAVYTQTRTLRLDPAHLRAHRVMNPEAPDENADAYKILRTQVLQRLRANDWRTLGVTATRKGHGKTLTALNLAISLAMEVNQTVLLADLDLRRPSLAGYLCAEKLKGISDYLVERCDLAEVLVNPGIDRLVILPGNEPLVNSSEELSSPRMVRLVEELKSRYPDRIVLFDLPPLLVGDDVMAFAPNLDAMILVLEEGKTTSEELSRALDLLHGVNILGTVLNKSVYNVDAPGYGAAR